MKVKKTLNYLSVFGIMAVYIMFLSCELGKQPVGPGVSSNPFISPTDSIIADSVTNNMRIFVNPATLIASNTDKAEVTVVVYDDNHNPLADRVIWFSSTHGIIDEADTTDDTGTATAIFRSVPVNAEARIVARLSAGDSLLAVATHVLLSGIKITITTEYIDALLNTNVPVAINVIDGAGQPVVDAELTLTGTTAASGQTDGNGNFNTYVTRSIQGTAIIKASAIGAIDSTSVRFWTVIPTGTVDTVQSIRSLRIFSSRTQLKANNSDQATITAILSDEKNNPLKGDNILFSCNLGIIDAKSSVDSTGRAYATLRSTPVNGICRVIGQVESKPELKDSVFVIFSGITLNLTADKTDLSVGDTTRIDALLTDGSGNPIGGDAIVFTITSSIGTFSDGTKTKRIYVDPAGLASIYMVSSSAGAVTVQAAGLNAIGITSVNFATNNITLVSDKSSIKVGGTDSIKITATYRDNSNQPVSGVAILFAANAGVITQDSVITNSSGQAVTYIKSSSFAGVATIQAQSVNRTAGTATLKVTFSAGTATHVDLAITPDNISINGGIATLIATVTDSNNNMVSSEDVNFRILIGPGGGEYIDKPIVSTYNGTARSNLLAGSQPSKYRGCEVIASLDNGVSATSKLTISGEPHIITISRPEDDTVTVSKGGHMNESTFEFFIGAVVQDINGNPVADGTKVQFSAVVSGMSVGILYVKEWLGFGSSSEEDKVILGYYYKDVPFEDINNNFRMDNNIDLKLDARDTIASRGDDVNGDGVCAYNPLVNDVFFDFNGNGTCDVGVGEPYKINSDGDTIYADLNQNGLLDFSELYVDVNHNGICDLPTNGDFRFSLWEMRPFFRGDNFKFETNDFAVVIDASVTTQNGVALTKLTYPRQLARRLYVTINSEANGIRDRDGERFVLPVVREQ